MPRSSFRRTSLVGAIALTLALGTQAANAGDDDPRKAQAESLFAEGMKLHDKERNTEALEKYRQAYAVYPTANILFGIARLEQLLGHRLEATRHYREALRDRLLHVRNQELGKTYVAELERDMVRVDVKAPAGTTFLVAGKRFVLPLDEPLDFEPGTIAIDGTFGDKRYTGSIVGVKGSRMNLELTSVDGKSTAGTTNPTTTVGSPPTIEGSRPWGPGQTVGVALAAVGLASLVAGGAFLIARGNNSSAISDLEPFTGADGARCQASPSLRQCSELEDQRDQRDRNTALSTGFFIGGAIALVAGAVTFFAWTRKPASQQGAGTTPIIGARAAGLQLRF